MIKIHRVIARMNVGGPAFHVAHLSAALGPPFKTTLITGEASADEGDMMGLALDAGVDVRTLSGLGRELNLRKDMRVLWSLYRMFREEAPQIVHTHTAKAGALGRIAAIMARVPVRIHTFHGHVLGGDYFTLGKTRAFLEIERQLARATQRIVALTEGQRTELADRFGVAPRNSFRVIPLGLDLDRFRSLDYPAGKERARAALGLPADSFVVASVGRLVAIKRHDLLLAALASLVGRGEVDWRVVVVGRGEREAELRRLADELDVADRVTWLGWRSDVPAVLEACDVLAQTSDDEGTPASVIEAMSVGLPVVATDVGGVGELLDGVPASWLTRPGSPAGLVDVLERAAASRVSVAEKTRDRFVRQFAVTRLTSDVAELYRTELDRAGIECEPGQPRM